MFKIRTVIQQLKEGSLMLKPTDFTPYYQFEHWHKAKINARGLKAIRREAFLLGIDPVQWGCPPEELSKPGIFVEPKGKLHQRLKPYKQEYISQLMEEMPLRIAQWKEVITCSL